MSADQLVLSGNITGASLVVDPDTGFLMSTSGYSLEGFSPTKKIKAVALAYEFWPHIARICESVGIHRNTFTNHYKLDKKFCESIDDARERALDDAESAMRARSMAPGGFMDRIALLKAYRPERWDREHRVSITHDVQLTQSIASKARQIVDTTATEDRS